MKTVPPMCAAVLLHLFCPNANCQNVAEKPVVEGWWDSFDTLYAESKVVPYFADEYQGFISEIRALPDGAHVLLVRLEKPPVFTKPLLLESDRRYTGSLPQFKGFGTVQVYLPANLRLLKNVGGKQVRAKYSECTKWKPVEIATEHVLANAKTEEVCTCADSLVLLDPEHKGNSKKSKKIMLEDNCD